MIHWLNEKGMSISSQRRGSMGWERTQIDDTHMSPDERVAIGEAV